MRAKRLLYLGYYFKELDKAKLQKFVQHAILKSGKSPFILWADILTASLKYNISILDYFYFRFYERGEQERSTYAGTGMMYEYQLKMNPKAAREVLENKILFLETYKPFVKRHYVPLADLLKSTTLIHGLLKSPSGKLVLKGSRGQVGAEVKVVQTCDFIPESLLQFMNVNKLDLAEEFVVQHQDLMKLSPSGLNTIRIFTQIKNGKLTYLGARLRITINSAVDNMAAGNIAAPIDIETGKVTGPGVFSDITKKDLDVHPVTGQKIIGFQVPYWKETLAMIEKAVFFQPQNRSIGWDVAISENGPELIEGNHNWCKLLWQLPVKKGLKSELEMFL